MDKELNSVFGSYEKKKRNNYSRNVIIKNILQLTEHKKFTIANLTENDIASLEQSVPPLIEDIDIPEEENPKYLGRFVKNIS